MNKYKEAWNNVYNFKNVKMMVGKSMNDLQELVKRVTPKKPIQNSIFKFVYDCPNNKCDDIVYPYMNFCSCCGQALDWSDNNE